MCDGANQPIEGDHQFPAKKRKLRRRTYHRALRRLLMLQRRHLGNGADGASAALVVASLEVGGDFDGGLSGEGGEGVHWRCGCVS